MRTRRYLEGSGIRKRRCVAASTMATVRVRRRAVVVMMLEKVPASLRGELTRWMIEPRTGVFVGKLSAMVRDRLWQRICEGMKGGAGILVHTSEGEQGFTFRLHGTPSRSVEDFDGLSLVR